MKKVKKLCHYEKIIGYWKDTECVDICTMYIFFWELSHHSVINTIHNPEIIFWGNCTLKRDSFSLHFGWGMKMLGAILKNELGKWPLTQEPERWLETQVEEQESRIWWGKFLERPPNAVGIPLLNSVIGILWTVQLRELDVCSLQLGTEWTNIWSTLE